MKRFKPRGDYATLQEQQQQMLNCAVSLRQQSLAQQWDTISDREAAALKAEFAEEDLALPEAVLTDYLPGLQQEDVSR